MEKPLFYKRCILYTHNIAYALSDIEAALAVTIRRSTWFALDEVFETLLAQNEPITKFVHHCPLQTILTLKFHDDEAVFPFSLL